MTERKGKPAPGRLRSVPAASSWLPFHLLFNSGARFAQQPLRKKKNNNNNTNNTHLTEDSSSRRYIPRLILPCVRLLLLKRRKSHQSGLRFVRLIPPNVKRRVRGSRQASSPESAPGRSVGRSVGLLLLLVVVGDSWGENSVRLPSINCCLLRDAKLRGIRALVIILQK